MLVSSAWPALRGQDEVAAEAIWMAAQEEAQASPSERIWVDAARVNTAVAPWQADYREARARLDEIAQRRRATLAHDRGGVRYKLPETP
jgi:hypothetical protein